MPLTKTTPMRSLWGRAPNCDELVVHLIVWCILQHVTWRSRLRKLGLYLAWPSHRRAGLPTCCSLMTHLDSAKLGSRQ